LVALGSVLPRLIKKLQLHTKVRVERPGAPPEETILKRNVRPIHVQAEVGPARYMSPRHRNAV
jgi:hypothetical protein